VGPWEEILQRAAALNPRDRHADAGELLRELTSSLEAAEAAAARASRPRVRERVPQITAKVSAGTSAPATEVIIGPPASNHRAGLFGFARTPAAKTPGNTTIAVGLGITAILVCGGIALLGSYRRSNEPDPDPTAEVTSRPHAAAMRRFRLRCVPSRPFPERVRASARELRRRIEGRGPWRVAEGHHVDTGAKPPHGAASAGPKDHRLTPTSSFE